MGTWQPLDGSDPTGILVTSGCLLQPLKCGCSHSKRPKVTGSKRKINPPSCPSLLWEACQTLSDGWRLQNPLQTMTPVIPPSLPLRASRRKLFFCFSDQGKLRHRDEGSGESGGRALGKQSTGNDALPSSSPGPQPCPHKIKKP